MPPKRKVTSAVKTSVKQAKTDGDTDEKLTLKKKLSALKKVEDKNTHKVDKNFCVAGNITCRVHEDYDCTLNQTDVKNNNNKFYIIQLIVLESNPIRYVVWTRWGRVGETGQSATLGPFDQLGQAITSFEKKFTDKTANKWDERMNFKFRPGKYSIIDVVDASEPDDVPVIQQTSDCLPSLLDEATQGFVRRIFSAETFEHAMRALNLDLKKMPLGKLSAKQIANAYEILDELEGVIEGKKKGDVSFLSSRFYTIMPHDFGRTRPPLIDTKELLASKFDMLNTLSDVALAQAMQKEGVKGNQKKKHWIDEKYSLLDCDLDYLNASDVNRRLVEEYFTETGRDWFEIVHVWRVNRKREGDRFRPYLKTGNHKLLWHGTNVAVVAAILKSGLRIMPHSGGLVGKGIYFASAADKSQDYGWADSDGYRIMFLAEVALGKEHPIFHSDSSIRKAPDGFDSVVAQGKFEPDPKFGKVLQLDGVPVNVLCSKPVQRDIDSWFYYSEYLIYNESQCRLRFVILYRPKK